MMILASVVVRGARQGDLHGGLYLIDPDRGTTDRVFEDREPFDPTGRGGDRGLRGLAIAEGYTWVAASRALIALDASWRVVHRIPHPALGHAHQIWAHDGWIFVTSTAFDSVLGFDLTAGRFRWGLLVRGRGEDLQVATFDPDRGSPPAGTTLHLNQIIVADGALWLSGRNGTHLIRVLDGTAEMVHPLPWGTHDPRPHAGGILFNDTESDCVCWRSPDGRETRIAVPRHPPADLRGLDPGNGALARQAFARGLCVTDDGRIFGGSSPATVAEYDLASGVCLRRVCLSLDVRHAVHGLIQWPNDGPRVC